MALVQGRNWLGREPVCTLARAHRRACARTQMQELWDLERELQASKMIHTVMKEK